MAKLKALGLRLDLKYEPTFVCVDCRDTGYQMQFDLQSRMYSRPCRMCTRGAKLVRPSRAPTGDAKKDKERGWKPLG